MTEQYSVFSINSQIPVSSKETIAPALLSAGTKMLISPKKDDQTALPCSYTYETMEPAYKPHLHMTAELASVNKLSENV